MKKLRSGYTTGACAAAAAKAATAMLLSGQKLERVSIPLPDGSRASFALTLAEMDSDSASAGVIKDGGDDPDITNGALIIARVTKLPVHAGERDFGTIEIVGGQGVGVVTKPGLSVPVGLPAINPVPRQMITDSVMEAFKKWGEKSAQGVQVRVIVPQGIELSKKTLNKRLGIIGGISILGTTGIVRPISAAAWTATIAAAMNVAEAAGVNDIILSTGRSSERCLESHLKPHEEALIMMGDYLEFALQEVTKHSFRKVHMAAMWAKLLKGAMKSPQTHVRHGIIEIDNILSFFSENGVKQELIDTLRDANTAREILERLLERKEFSVVEQVCDLARDHYVTIAKIPVTVHLVHGSGNLICSR